LVGYSRTFFDVLIKEIAHAPLYLFHQMKFIVDPVNALFASPIHLTNFKVSLMSQSTNIVSDLFLDPYSHVHPVHQFSLADVVNVLQILALNFINPHRLRQ
jgi:hypothetical protein